MKKENLPKKIAVFPLSNFIIFPNTTVPLNIFEPRYIEMINDCMKSDKLLGIIQPKMHKIENQNIPELHKIGCLGKIIDLQKTDDNRYLIELKGLIRFDIISEINSKKNYRECDVSFDKFYDDLELIFKDLRNLFEKRGFIINWKALENQSLDETINALAMASPFTLEEKQVLLETKNLDARKSKIADILKTYTFDNYNNTTIQ